MTISSIGDLAASFQLRRDTARIKTDLNRLSGELSSGVAEDLVSRFKGDFGPLAAIERGLVRAESYRSVVAEHRGIMTAMQTTLSNLRKLGDISGTLLTAPDSSDPTLIRNAGSDAEARMSSAVKNLNTQVGGRTIFSGVSYDRPALADSDVMLLAIEAEIALAGAVTAVDIQTVVTTWFASGGGFDTVGYIGGAGLASGPRLSDGETAPPPPTGEDTALRNYLAALTLGALLGRNALSGDLPEQQQLARMAGQDLVSADAGVVDLQATLGVVEAQTQRASVEIETEADGLALARSRLVEVDPYEAAVELQTSEAQLQTIYTLTARLSRLSLTEYL